MTLANHAQQIAKIALEQQGSGINLVQDVKVYSNFSIKKGLILNTLIQLC